MPGLFWWLGRDIQAFINIIGMACDKKALGAGKVDSGAERKGVHERISQ